MGPGCQLFELPVQINQTEIAALLDCEDTYNYISSGLFEQLQWQSSTGPSLTVTIANTQVVMTEKNVTVPLQLRLSSLQISF